MQQLPSNFDVDLIGDDSRLPADALAAMRELAFRKASVDPLWFLEQFWHVLNPKTFSWERFKLRDYQKKELARLVEASAMERSREVRLKARQIGWTTMGSAFMFHDAFFNANHPWLLTSQGEDEAKDTLATKVKVPYNMLPIWLRERGPKVIDQNSERMTLDNGSTILSIPSTSSSGRSKSVYGVLVDEYAYVQDAEGLLTALDPLCYGPLVVFSTANGMGNPFHKLYVDSTRIDSEWRGAFEPWWVVPGRDEVWYEREKRKYRGREHEFFQEYPSTPEEAFAKTGRTAMPMDLLRDEQDWIPPTYKVDLALADYSLPLDSQPLLDGDADEELWVWEPPSIPRDSEGFVIQKPNYVVGVDVAEGLLHGDRTSLTVWNANTLQVVATYLGYWPVEDLGPLTEWIGYSYHTALILVERNNHGILPLDYLRRARYPRLYRMDFLAQIPSGDRTPRYGWFTNKATKPKMVASFVKGLRDGLIAVHDTRFLAEASTFVSDGKGGYAAAPGSHDDHIIGHMMGYQGCLDVGAYPVVWADDRPRPTTMGDLQQIEYLNNKRPSGLGEPIGQRAQKWGHHAFRV